MIDGEQRSGRYDDILAAGEVYIDQAGAYLVWYAYGGIKVGGIMTESHQLLRISMG